MRLILLITMDYKEFKSRKEAEKVIAELDRLNGYPIKGNTTQTTADIEEIEGAYYIDSKAIDKQVDLSKATDEKIEKKLLNITLEKTKEKKK